MRLNPENTSPSSAGKLIFTTSTDPFTRGLDYLYGVRSLALDAEMIDVVYDLENRKSLCVWICEHIDAVNQQLEKCLQACHDCFHPWEQPTIQIFAAPIAQSFGIDALCNLQTNPITILIDVGRVVPADWLALVVHEYAHAHAGSPGHHEQFARSLSHLCLGLGIAPPPLQPGMESYLRFYPDCRPTQNPLAFWRGESGTANEN
ncbi:hypothetical protein HCG51_24415 [Tolypothrix sp. PCC 7910]|uniref:hypothetical protein n=1 Tax=Tolypothrix sp. PCC 7910 TaxID=2099387 RepID=UPI0014277534|nr:hypothetical protein [Tolypothrix sp. PCC 7910]QIR39540.1 hypothetical protein HCG51_24415 [Tolypothrix sp. PCC 7910]